MSVTVKVTPCVPWRIEQLTLLPRRYLGTVAGSLDTIARPVTVLILSTNIFLSTEEDSWPSRPRDGTESPYVMRYYTSTMDKAKTGQAGCGGHLAVGFLTPTFRTSGQEAPASQGVRLRSFSSAVQVAGVVLARSVEPTVLIKTAYGFLAVRKSASHDQRSLRVKTFIDKKQ